MDGVARIDVFARAGGKSYEGARGLKERVEAATACKVNLYELENADQLRASIADSDILVNGTNVGMGVGNTDTPVPPEFIKPGMVVADVINTPEETQLLKFAQERGCRTYGGVGMREQQAVVADRIRFGVDIPIEEIAAELAAAK